MWPLDSDIGPDSVTLNVTLGITSLFTMPRSPNSSLQYLDISRLLCATVAVALVVSFAVTLALSVCLLFYLGCHPGHHHILPFWLEFGLSRDSCHHPIKWQLVYLGHYHNHHHTRHLDFLLGSPDLHLAIYFTMGVTSVTWIRNLSQFFVLLPRVYTSFFRGISVVARFPYLEQICNFLV